MSEQTRTLVHTIVVRVVSTLIIGLFTVYMFTKIIAL